MTEEEYQQAKFLRHRLASERDYLRQQELFMRTGGRRHSHLASSYPGLATAQELANEAKEKDASNIEESKALIALLEAEFAALGQPAPDEVIVKPERKAKARIRELYFAGQSVGFDSKTVNIILTADSYIDWETGMAKPPSPLKESDILNFPMNGLDVRAIVKSKAGDRGNTIYELEPLQCSYTNLVECLDYWRKNGLPFEIN